MTRLFIIDDQCTAVESSHNIGVIRNFSSYLGDKFEKVIVLTLASKNRKNFANHESLFYPYKPYSKWKKLLFKHFNLDVKMIRMIIMLLWLAKKRRISSEDSILFTNTSYYSAVAFIMLCRFLKIKPKIHFRFINLFEFTGPNYYIYDNYLKDVVTFQKWFLKAQRFFGEKMTASTETYKYAALLKPLLNLETILITAIPESPQPDSKIYGEMFRILIPGAMSRPNEKGYFRVENIVNILNQKGLKFEFFMQKNANYEEYNKKLESIGVTLLNASLSTEEFQSAFTRADLIFTPFVTDKQDILESIPHSGYLYRGSANIIRAIINSKDIVLSKDIAATDYLKNAVYFIGQTDEDFAMQIAARFKPEMKEKINESISENHDFFMTNFVEPIKNFV